MKKHVALLGPMILGISLSAISVAEPETSPPPLVIIVMENKAASEIVGNPSAPFMNDFIAMGVRFTHYQEGEARGPSLADYLQLAAGSSCGRYSDKALPGDSEITSQCPTTLWNQLESRGRSWGVYMEGMPSACSPAVTHDDDASGGQYALKHNPATPFKSVYDDPALCLAHVLPYSSFDPAKLPDVSFVSPNGCNDMHGSKSKKWTKCRSHTSALFERGDQWLAERVPGMLAHGAQVFITFDEDGTLYAVAAGPGLAAGTSDDTPYTHYSFLAAVEDRFGLPRLGAANAAQPLPLNSFRPSLPVATQAAPKAVSRALR
ncbi:MAG: hypothetical protein E4H11_03100 [Myxococcales bacterium]|nr:MAG: hypothetical protein E4H11_03100 [Myxococcales bacterium]